jgi:predicted AAA+ superfamily ATPase
LEDIKLILITLSEENIIQYQGSTIFVVPAWKWLLLGSWGQTNPLSEL